MNAPCLPVCAAVCGLPGRGGIPARPRGIRTICGNFGTANLQQDKSAPSHEALVAICKRYHVSADYLLGLTDTDPSYLRRISSRFSTDELRELQEYSFYLLWKRGRNK